MVSSGGIRVKRRYLADITFITLIAAGLFSTIFFIVREPFFASIAMFLSGCVTGILIAEIIDSWHYLKGGK